MYVYFWQHFFIDTYVIEHYRLFCLHTFSLILLNCRIEIG